MRSLKDRLNIDVVDSIHIRAPAQRVFATVANYPAIANWFPPYSCSVEGGGDIKEGALVQHCYGRPPFVLSRFTRRIERIVDGERIEERYIDGDLRGTGVWCFEQHGQETLASYHCRVEALSWFARLGFVLQGSRAHSEVYQQYLAALKQQCEAAGV
ncbi:SRPBCC family protein [Spongiibacter marinus]|uniref:SRPBCC family protein n=1 Tax=Spongiibacter marinus TaxID=354246 RepID=UPI00195FC045|nr:SRPBCC family protein [Spongiibacter marinus]MBM7423182.1 uncharacterized protein YndB with AHSA1/START domain [Spongiibacter marinus]